MGGLNETNISGLRFHRNSGKVHIHQDSISTKFIKDEKVFKREVSSALSDLQSDGSDGIVMIDGDTDVSLGVGQKNNNIFIFLHHNKKTVKSTLSSFTKSI